MYILTVHWDLRLLWVVLSVTAKFYIVCLLVAGAYTIFFLVRNVLGLRRLLRNAASIDGTHLDRSLVKITRGMDNLRQFHTLLFALSGVSCANEMFRHT